MMKKISLMLALLCYMSCQSPQELEQGVRLDSKNVHNVALDHAEKKADVVSDAKPAFEKPRGTKMKEPDLRREKHHDEGNVSGEFTHAISNETAYYVTGPQQGSPPNGYLKPGTKIKVHKDSIGDYFLVETLDGIKGYVSSVDVKKIN